MAPKPMRRIGGHDTTKPKEPRTPMLVTERELVRLFRETNGIGKRAVLRMAATQARCRGVFKS